MGTVSLTKQFDTVMGNKRVGCYKLTMSDDYATGGDAMPDTTLEASIGWKKVETVLPIGQADYELDWEVLLGSDLAKATVGSTGAEVANTTDLSGVDFLAFVVGY